MQLSMHLKKTLIVFVELIGSFIHDLFASRSAGVIFP